MELKFFKQIVENLRREFAYSKALLIQRWIVCLLESVILQENEFS